jgi:hypothetical protein
MILLEKRAFSIWFFKLHANLSGMGTCLKFSMLSPISRKTGLFLFFFPKLSKNLSRVLGASSDFGGTLFDII